MMKEWQNSITNGKMNYLHTPVIPTWVLPYQPEASTFPVYRLVGNGTASASELVINSLEGIDLDVILIGEKRPLVRT